LYDNKTWKSIPYPTSGLAGGGVKSIVMASDGTLWGNSTIYVYNSGYHVRLAHLVNNTWTLYEMKTSSNPPSITPITSMYSDKVWALQNGNVGTDMHPSFLIYILRFDGVAWSQIATIAGVNTCWAIGPDDSIWIGTVPAPAGGIYSEGGLYQFKDGNLTSYSKANGLLDNSVSSVAVSPDGTVWVQTKTGISRYGNSIPTGVKSSQDVPREFAIKGNFPNPFNPSTTIEFTLASPGKTTLVVYDIMGRMIRELVSGQILSGKHTVLWDGKDDSGRSVSSGVYIARLTAGNHTAVQKMLMMK